MNTSPHEKDPRVEVQIGTYKNLVHRVTLFENRPFELELGARLGPIDVAYETWGELNDDGTNAVLIVHALTGDSHVASHSLDDHPGWFEDIVGRGCSFDPRRHYIVCANWLGSNYGSTGPTATNPKTGKPFDDDFPQITIGDMSRIQKSLTDHLEIPQWHTVIGGSVGGMIVLDFATRFPGALLSAITMATAFRASPWVIAFHEIMRRVLSIGHDSGDEDLLRRALEVARMVGIMTYRSRGEFVKRYRRARAELHWQDEGCSFAVESYLRHQGMKLDERFDPTTYSCITKAADMFDLSETHGSLSQALARLRCPVLAVGIDSDYLFPLEEQQEIVDEIHGVNKSAELGVIESENGHDGFLTEHEQLGRLIVSFLDGVQ